MWDRIKVLLNTKVPGFSLLEISIVLLIMGVVLSFSLPYLTSQLSFEKRKKTELVFEEITHALSNFVVQNGRLPYPAKINALGDAQGQEDINIPHGVVPYKTLGISPASAKDGQQHWISYTPHPDLLDDFLARHNQGGGDYFCTNPLGANLQIIGVNGEVLSGEGTFQPAFVLVSHGSKGGDLMESGNRRAYTIASPCKVSNGDDDLVFADHGITSSCDDSLFWKNRQILMSAYAHKPCERAD